MTDIIDTILDDPRFVADLLLGGRIDYEATAANEAATEAAGGSNGTE